MTEARRRLDQPKAPRGLRRPHISSDAVGSAAETIARFFGTARYLLLQTLIVIVWIAINAVWGINYAHHKNSSSKPFDPYPFILLNLAFSTQAAYAAPLILLAQNRQEKRDRIQTDNDRRVAERTQADTEFLAREISSVRLSLGDVATSTELEDQLERVTRAIERMADRLEELERRADKDQSDG